LKPLAALALARAGDVTRAEGVADELARDNPLSTIQNFYWIPAIRAAIALKQNNSARAIELLESAATYELGYSEPLQVGTMYPAFLRGEAYLDLHQSKEAAAEFQKFLDHRGVVLNYSLAALARIGLARANAMQGDTARAKTEYREFFTLWKDADLGIPIYTQAKAEYARMQ
jgi:tetratricopeptide (TPR) repeat protein